MIRAVVLDFDGLIIDSEIAVARSWSELFEREGFSFSEDLWRTMVGTRENDNVLWDELERLTGRRPDIEALDAARRTRSVELADTLEPLPGVVDLIEQARQMGLRLGVASSSGRWWVAGHLERLGLLEYFEVVCTKEDTPRSKPFPDIYIKAVEALGVAAEEAVAFEDSGPGAAAAKAAGLRVVAVPGSYTEHMDFSTADVVLESLAGIELGALVERLSSAR